MEERGNERRHRGDSKVKEGRKGGYTAEKGRVKGQTGKLRGRFSSHQRQSSQTDTQTYSQTHRHTARHTDELMVYGIG